MWGRKSESKFGPYETNYNFYLNVFVFFFGPAFFVFFFLRGGRWWCLFDFVWFGVFFVASDFGDCLFVGFHFFQAGCL